MHKLYQREHLIRNRSRLPDHCMLSFTFKSTGLHVEDFVKGLGTKTPNTMRSCIVRKYKKNFMVNPRIRETMLRLIEERLNELSTQEEVDGCYSELCHLISTEMNHCKKIGKRKSTPHKAYWNESLSELWAKMSESYKMLQEKGISIKKKNLNHCKKGTTEMNMYKKCVAEFDKELRKAKKLYNQGHIVKIDECLSKDPNRFWEEVNKLGPRSNKKVMCEAIDAQGNITRDKKLVMEHWSTEYRGLYGNQPDYDFDQNFLDEQIDKNRSDADRYVEGLDPHVNQNIEIAREEILKAVNRARDGKAVGCDKIPYEAMKNSTCVDMLTKLCNKCFQLGKLPSMWNKAMINPIPKGNSSVSTDPLSFRGIAIQSCVYKIYSYVLNTRLSSHMENTMCLSNVQNGFRKGWSCNDHVFVLTKLVKAHLNEKTGNKVYCAFVDKKKAFDFVNISMLERRLRDCDVQGKLLRAYLGIYASPQYSVLVNGEESDYFSSVLGLKQGDNSSPLFYSIYINDLLKELQCSGLGLKMGNEHIAVLAYADDLVLIADSEDKLQKQLDLLSVWCRKWRMVVSEEKTKIVIFKRKRTTRPSPTFWYHEREIEVVSSYKYLGIHLDEHLDFNECRKHLSTAGGRALGGLINRCKHLPGLSARTYSRLYHSCVTSILDYGGEIWGLNNSKIMEDIQSRAARYF